MKRDFKKRTCVFTVIIFIFLILLSFVENGFSQTKRETKKWKKCKVNIGKTSNPDEMINIYEKFIKKYPQNFYIQVAKEKIADLKFNKVKSINTIEAYKDFVKTYPNSNYVKEAEENIERIEFDNMTLKNTFGEYQKFIKKYPQSKYAEQARGRIQDIKNAIRKQTKIIRLKFDIETSSLLGKWSFNPKKYIIESLKKTGFEVVQGEDQKYDIIIKVIYKESGGWKFHMEKGVSKMWYSVPDIEYKITLKHDSYGELILKEKKFRSGSGLYKKEEFKKDARPLSYWKSNLSNFKKDISFKYFSEFLLSKLGDEKPLSRALEKDG